MQTMIVLVAQTVVTVFAAASLHRAFPELGKQFEKQHPGVRLTFEFNGSQMLEAQLAQGAKADVFASADPRWMDYATKDGLVGSAASFAGNNIVIAASKASKVLTASDLTKPGIRIIVCAEAAPCGRYATLTIGEMDGDPAFGKGYAAGVVQNVVSVEENVESVLAKVSRGEADAGFVYRSDIVGPVQNVRVIELPTADQPTIVYRIAACKHSASSDLAAAFVAYVRSTDGQTTLRRFDFTPAP